MNDTEIIEADGVTLAMVISGSYEPTKTTFVTPDSFYQQGGFVIYPAGGHIPSHYHTPIERHLTITSETLIVRKGVMNMRLYDKNLNLVATRRIQQGDIVILVAGGHGFDVLEDVVLYEIKQGPYTGLVEKIIFKVDETGNAVV
jgi:hypothetical protein